MFIRGIKVQRMLHPTQTWGIRLFIKRVRVWESTPTMSKSWATEASPKALVEVAASLLDLIKSNESITTALRKVQWSRPSRISSALARWFKWGRIIHLWAQPIRRTWTTLRLPRVTSSRLRLLKIKVNTGVLQATLNRITSLRNKNYLDRWCPKSTSPIAHIKWLLSSTCKGLGVRCLRIVQFRKTTKATSPFIKARMVRKMAWL